MMLKQSLALSLLAVLAACSKQALETTDAPAATATAKFELSADPGAATSVVKAKADGAKDHVVVEGRIYDITKGFAVLKLMDMELDYCGEVNKEGDAGEVLEDDAGDDEGDFVFAGGFGVVGGTGRVADRDLCDVQP